MIMVDLALKFLLMKAWSAVVLIITLMEPTFCEMYAKFCVQLVAELPEFYKDNEKVIFKRELLNKCQEEFERD